MALTAIVWACAVTASALSADPVPPASRQASVVRLIKQDAGYQLLRDGKPYFIKGAGGDSNLKALAEAGGNSIRTWGADKVGPLLDEAHQLGLTVTVGIWLGHERHGFDYNNADQVAEQYERARKTILRYKDHPAVLLWGIGNEMEGYGAGDNAAVWSAVNNIAALAKRLDPNHPTMTVVAEVGGSRVRNIHRLCPQIDVVGINSYGGVLTLAERYRKAGGTKPYVITEFGPPGVWETNKNDWGAVPELTSTAKAEFYRRAYRQAVAAHRDLCLGSYVFVWGHKQEATATWFGMFLPDGSRLGPVDAMTEEWSGKPPANLCPKVEPLKLEGPDQVEPGATVRVRLTAADPEGDPLKVRWALHREAESYNVGGDNEAETEALPDTIVKSDEKHAELRMPKGGGNYRLYAFVYDDHGGAAVANVPIRVKGPVTAPAAKRAKLPLVLYDEDGREHLPFHPSGWMGNTKAIKLDPACTEKPHAGKTCLRCEYRDRDGWGGVVWQNPANDWGDRPGGWDLSGAKRLTFWARGDEGGETLSVEFGLLGRDKRFHDTAKGKLDPVKLTKEWQQFSIDLRDKDLTRIKTGFAWVVRGSGRPVVFYLDDIQFEGSRE